ncbi:hypothetical protein VG539_004050 [Cronobacter muytjensii]|uniref:hypothetical protein n=1 Tax=Cronobacter muytjensii TaxID=413501 RepID=UPI000283F51F|nr:hypothetical protein [Cronobacter muytjensii]MDI6457876.1 hypothetical protein [Cronobacter muytjensii]
MTEQNENNDKGFTRTLTVRNVPLDVDLEITEQAKVAGKSKSDFVKEFLSASFGDLIGNFMRSDGLVALMDHDVAKMMNARLTDYFFDSAQTCAENRTWCHLLRINKQEDLQRIMRDGVPYLELRAQQLRDVTHIPHGTSLAFALFIEAARRDLSTLLDVHQALFYLQKEENFLDMVDQIRQARHLPPTARPVF